MDAARRRSLDALLRRSLAALLALALALCALEPATAAASRVAAGARSAPAAPCCCGSDGGCCRQGASCCAPATPEPVETSSGALPPAPEARAPLAAPLAAAVRLPRVALAATGRGGRLFEGFGGSPADLRHHLRNGVFLE